MIEKCVAAAGFSVGEFAALVFAGAMEFTEGTQEEVVVCVCVAGILRDKGYRAP